MAPELSPSTAFISLIMVCVLTISYCAGVGQTFSRKPLSLRRPILPGGRLYPQSFAAKSCSPAVPNLLHGRRSQKDNFASSRSQRQQRWAKRPVSTPVLFPIVTASCPPFILLLSPFTAPLIAIAPGNLPLLPGSSPSTFFLSEALEAIQLLGALVEAEVVKSLAFRSLRSFHPRRERQSQHQDEHPVRSQVFLPSRMGRINWPEGRSVHDPVKDLGRKGITSGGAQSGFPSSQTYSGLMHFLIANKIGSSNLQWRGVHFVSSSPPPHNWRGGPSLFLRASATREQVIHESPHCGR